MNQRATQSNGRLFQHILLPFTGVLLALIGLTAFEFYWAAHRSDRVSVERQVRTAQHSLDASVDDLAYEQQSASLWDALVLELRKPAPDLDWMDANIGAWMYRMFGHDQSWTLNAQDEPSYGSVKGTRVTLDQFAKLQPFIQQMIDEVRGRAMTTGVHDRSAGRPLLPNSTVRTEPRAVHATRFLKVFNRPAAASVMKIVPLTDQLSPEIGAGSLFVSIRFLDGDFVARLASRDLLDGLRFSDAPNAVSGENVLALSGEDGRPIGYFFWRPELPGSDIMRLLGPVTLLVLAVLLGLMSVLMRSLWRSNSCLELAIGNLKTAMAELQTSEARSQHLAMHDALTGLPNRTLFDERLGQALTHASRGERIALLAVDLDRFKNVNDTLGHGAGDALLKDFAVRLSASVRESDTVARVGGDEFMILQREVGGQGDIEGLCARILTAAKEPFILQDVTAHVGVSIGIAMTSDAPVDRTELLRRADIALYRAKENGRGGHVYFTSLMGNRVRLQGELEDELREALAGGEQIKAYFQPVVNLIGAIVGFEALTRWEHPSRGLVLPDQFIPIAEETGLIAQLTDRVFGEACQLSRRWPDLLFAVNLSPVQFRSAEFADHLISMARACGADPKRLQLEITERLFLENDAVCRETFRKLREAGFTIALDDFGTGYSTLKYLSRFKFDKIKIDRSFIENLNERTEVVAIVRSVATLGQAMGLTVTAEGVETVDQMRSLSSIGCNELQGNLFSPALPPNRIEDWLSSHACLYPPATSRIVAVTPSPSSASYRSVGNDSSLGLDDDRGRRVSPSAPKTC